MNTSRRASLLVLLTAMIVFVTTTQLWLTTKWLDATRTAAMMIVRHPDDSELLGSDDKGKQPTVPTLSTFRKAYESKAIRQWGCHRSETPFIYVHIGKSGGGSHEARIAAASIDYSGMPKRNQPHTQYYPLRPSGNNRSSNSNSSKARFVSYMFPKHLPTDQRTMSGTTPCHASTPVGHAIACPDPMQYARVSSRLRQGECDMSDDTCHLVYIGHNFVGSEMHWLPVRYLQQWWQSVAAEPPTDTALPWERLLPKNTWCIAKNTTRPATQYQYKQHYEDCSIPLQRQIDAMTHNTFAQLQNDDDDDDNDNKNNIVTSWTPLYASLPVLRVTVMRDPFTWLVSKYFWHRSNKDSTCDNLVHAIGAVANETKVHRYADLGDGTVESAGWVTRMALAHIITLCGEECLVRYVAGTASLADLEAQAEGNLRQAFAVVGILEGGGTDTFYNMLTARVQYIDTSLNANVRGPKHSTRQHGESRECKARFQDPDFQAALLSRSPELRALNRLYGVAKEVNRFQVQELKQCSPESFSSST